MEPKPVVSRNLFRVQCLPLCNDRNVDINKTYQTYCVKLEYVDGINVVCMIFRNYFLLSCIFIDMQKNILMKLDGLLKNPVHSNVLFSCCLSPSSFSLMGI